MNETNAMMAATLLQLNVSTENEEDATNVGVLAGRISRLRTR